MELGESAARDVALLTGAVGDDRRERRRGHPLGDHDLRRARDDAGDHEPLVVGVDAGECPLIVRLDPVVEFVLGARVELLDDGACVDARHHRGDQSREAREGFEIGPQCFVGARVLDLDGDVAAVVPHRAMHLTDARRGRGIVVELAEPRSPVGAELACQHPVDVPRRHGRGCRLEFGERFAIRLGEILGNRGLHDAQCLPELHRAALEFTEYGEELFGGPGAVAGLDFGAVAAGEPAAEAHGRAARHPERQTCEFRGSGRASAGNL